MVSKEEFDWFVWPALLLVAFITIVPYIIVHYMSMGFNVYWFFGFELPLYAFLMWAMYKMFKIKHKFDKLYENDKR